MPGQPLRGIAFRLQRDLVRGMIEGQSLQPAPIPHRPRLCSLINPPVTQHEGRDELALVALFLRGAFPGSDQSAHRLMRCGGDPDGGQFSGTKKASRASSRSVLTRSPTLTGIRDSATTQQSPPQACPWIYQFRRRSFHGRSACLSPSLTICTRRHAIRIQVDPSGPGR